MVKPLIIYIAGYGRSGSTALDAALGATCANAVSLGEAIGLPRSATRKRIGCSCGEAYDACDVWAHCLKQSKINKEYWLSVSRYDGLLRLNACSKSDYSKFWRYVLKARLNAENRKASGNVGVQKDIAIDSSKTTVCTSERPRNLLRLNVADVFVVHVRRSLRGVLAARRKGRNVELASEKSKSALSNREKVFGLIWYIVVPLHLTLANLFAKRLKRVEGLVGYFEAEFDQVSRNPEAVALEIWDQVAAKTDRQIVVVSPQNDRIHVDHFVEGNRLLQGESGVRIRPAPRC